QMESGAEAIERWKEHVSRARHYRLKSDVVAAEVKAEPVESALPEASSVASADEAPDAALSVEADEEGSPAEAEAPVEAIEEIESVTGESDESSETVVEAGEPAAT